MDSSLTQQISKCIRSQINFDALFRWFHDPSFQKHTIEAAMSLCKGVDCKSLIELIHSEMCAALQQTFGSLEHLREEAKKVGYFIYVPTTPNPIPANSNEMQQALVNAILSPMMHTETAKYLKMKCERFVKLVNKGNGNNLRCYIWNANTALWQSAGQVHIIEKLRETIQSDFAAFVNSLNKTPQSPGLSCFRLDKFKQKTGNNTWLKAVTSQFIGMCKEDQNFEQSLNSPGMLPIQGGLLLDLKTLQT